MVEIFKGGVPVIETLERWYEEFKLEGFGAMIPFIGIVRPDGGIEGLSFDLYLPMLNEWFKKWEELKDAKIIMAHSFGDVMVGESSFLCAVFTKHRREGFKYLEELVEILRQMHLFGNMILKKEKEFLQRIGQRNFRVREY